MEDGWSEVIIRGVVSLLQTMLLPVPDDSPWDHDALKVIGIVAGDAEVLKGVSMVIVWDLHMELDLITGGTNDLQSVYI